MSTSRLRDATETLVPREPIRNLGIAPTRTTWLVISFRLLHLRVQIRTVVLHRHDYPGYARGAVTGGGALNGMNGQWTSNYYTLYVGKKS